MKYIVPGLVSLGLSLFNTLLTVLLLVWGYKAIALTAVSYTHLPFHVTRLCRKAMRGLSCRLLAVHHNAPDCNARLEGLRMRTVSYTHLRL